jgi:serine/threonine protein kinase
MPSLWTILPASRFINGLSSFFPSVHQGSLDISQSVVLVGNHYIAIGEHADLWIGDMFNKKVAVKVLRGGSSSNPDFLQKFKERLEREALVWRRLQHPNVAQFYGLAFSFGYMPALILPFYSNGGVVEYVRGKNDRSKLDMVRQIAAGLKYLHDNSVVHGDLRGANVLVDHDGCARICDYGLAFIIEPSEFTSIKTAGACRWTAPEIMSPAENTQVTNGNDPAPLFTKKSDIYAFGMTMLEIFTGKMPFSQKKNDSSVIFYVLDGGRPELPPFLAARESLRKLVQDCWASEPNSRPTSRAVSEILDTSSMHENSSTSSIEIPDTGWLRSWL